MHGIMEVFFRFYIFKRSAKQSFIDFIVCDIMLFAIILHVKCLNCIGLLCNMHARCFLLEK